MAKKNKKQKKKKNTKGEYGETVISNFGGAVNAIKHRYQADFPDMEIFLHFNAMGKNYVFQRIKGFPIKQIHYATEGHSIKFNAFWQSEGALDYIMPKTSFEIETRQSGDTVEWQDVSTFRFKSMNRFNPAESMIPRGKDWKYISEADEIETDTEIRIDNVKSINMYNWGFELIGEVISLIAINVNVKSPFSEFNISMNLSNLSFDFSRLTENDSLTVRWSMPGYEPIIAPDFNKVLFGEEEKPEIQVKNIGQRCMKNLMLED